MMLLLVSVISAILGFWIGCILGVSGRSALDDDHHAIEEAEKDRIHYLLTTHQLWSTQGTYTFPDGVEYYQDM